MPRPFLKNRQSRFSRRLFDGRTHRLADIALYLSLAARLDSLRRTSWLGTKEEKKSRWEADQKWIALLEKDGIAAFLQTWYAQPLFETMRKKDELISKRSQRDPRILIDMMKSMCLAHQPKLEVFSPTLFLHGAEDLKYANIYSEMPCVEAVADAGHAAHSDNPRAVSDAIRRFVEQHS